MDEFPKIGKQSGYFGKLIMGNTSTTSTSERRLYSPIRNNYYDFYGQNT